MTCVRPADARQLRWNNRLWMARTSASGDYGRGSPSFQFDDNKLRRLCVAGIPPLMHNVRLKAQNLTRSRGPHTLALDLRQNGALHDKDNFQAIQMSMTLVHTTGRVLPDSYRRFEIWETVELGTSQRVELEPRIPTTFHPQALQSRCHAGRESGAQRLHAGQRSEHLYQI